MIHDKDFLHNTADRLAAKTKKIIIWPPTWFEHATFWSGVKRATINVYFNRFNSLKSHTPLWELIKTWNNFIYAKKKEMTWSTYIQTCVT